MAKGRNTIGEVIRGRGRRVRTPTVLQLEAAECGAASLAMILGYHGRHLPLEVLRAGCGVSRDGSKASNILKAARSYGLTAKGLKVEPQNLKDLSLPSIAFVDFCHFLVIEGYDRQYVYLNDPAQGRRRVDLDTFDAMFTGVILTFQPADGFVKSDDRPGLRAALFARTAGLRMSIAFVFLASLALVVPGIIIPLMSRVFIDHIMVRGFGDWMAPLIVGMIATALIRFATTELQRWSLTQAETRLAVDSARELFTHILKLPVSYFGTRYAGEVAGRLYLSDGLAELLTGDVARTALNIVTATFFLVL
ncbi:MAG: NHLP family bacteriocin export ABC transporter peptidase/permease/ATPase, partial [Rhodospirillales bacterium]|nr:NHLP family bacteriocin export ABC transporter peptidase/permease/ATPase [Rhodospirillales bacterium]